MLLSRELPASTAQSRSSNGSAPDPVWPMGKGMVETKEDWLFSGQTLRGEAEGSRSHHSDLEPQGGAKSVSSTHGSESHRAPHVRPMALGAAGLGQNYNPTWPQNVAIPASATSAHHGPARDNSLHSDVWRPSQEVEPLLHFTTVKRPPLSDSRRTSGQAGQVQVPWQGWCVLSCDSCHRHSHWGPRAPGTWESC